MRPSRVADVDAEPPREVREAAEGFLAARVGIDPWPPELRQRRPGRPSDQELYERELHEWVRDNRYKDPDRLPPTAAPSWWRPGTPVLAEALPFPEEGLLEGEESSAEEDGPPAKKRKRRGYFRAPTPLASWVVRYALLRKQNFGWTFPYTAGLLRHVWPATFDPWLTPRVVHT